MSFMSANEKTNSVLILNRDPQFKFHRKKLTQFIKLILKTLGYRDKTLSLVFVTDSEIKRLNRAYLNHSWATDVLAFPYPRTQKFLGEVIVSPKRAKLYSKKIHISYREELARYMCHGILHLRGYLDDSKKERAIMEQKENELIRLAVPVLAGTGFYYRFKQNLSRNRTGTVTRLRYGH
jgi:probable rRNA maturation factor